MPINHTWNATRQQLENKVVEAAQNLLKFIDAESFELPIPDTSPPLFVSVGPGGEPPFEDMGE